MQAVVAPFSSFEAFSLQCQKTVSRASGHLERTSPNPVSGVGAQALPPQDGNLFKLRQRHLCAVDHSARGSMKSAASCVN